MRPSAPGFDKGRQVGREIMKKEAEYSSEIRTTVYPTAGGGLRDRPGLMGTGSLSRGSSRQSMPVTSPSPLWLLGTLRT